MTRTSIYGLGQLTTSATALSYSSSRRSGCLSPLQVTVPVGCGAVLAAAVTARSWILVALMMAMSLVVLVPVEFALGLLSFTIYFDNLNPFHGGITLSFLTAAISGCILLLASLAGKRFAAPSRAAGWFALFLLWTMLSTFWAMHREVALQRLPSIASLGALYLIIGSMRIADREFKSITRLIVYGGCIASVISLYQFAHGSTVVGRASIILGNVATNPNELAISLLLPLSMAIGLVLSERGVARGMFVIASLLLLTCLLLTMSRGGFVGLSVMIVIYIYRRGIDWRLLTAVILTVSVLLLASSLLMTRLDDALASRAQGRLDIWLVGFEVVKHHGLFGVGLDNFPLAFDRYAGHQKVFHFFSMAPHNIYMQALAETGAVGLSLLVGALTSQMRQVAGILRDGGARAAALVVPCEAAAWGVMTHAVVANVLWHKVFWFVWIMAALTVRLAPREDRYVQRI